ncbi:MAG: protein kinase [Acidobacteriota bacterium]
MSLSPGSHLGPYEILAALGAGGMGEVYRAKDMKLGRDVALKVLPQEFFEDRGRVERFEREAKLLAALNHPNVATIHAFEEVSGRHLLVMELVEGTTLRDKLDAGPLPQRKAVDYAVQIARGLSAAHEKGIVHRDLKPENLFVTKDGHLKILDFGLAKRAQAAPAPDVTSAPTKSQHTEPGTVFGTVAYMSPEQVRGLPLDHRSDIFSFGVVLYEMLSGRRAFKRDTSAETMTAILREEPPDLSGSGKNIPPALDRIVGHCLEKSPERRFGSAHDVAFALEEAVAAATSGQRAAAFGEGRHVFIKVVAGAVALLAVAGAFLFLRQRRGGPAAGPKRVAVLPFENLGAPEDDYFADGIADEVRGKLTSLPGLEVIARASSTPYKKTSKTPAQIARELEARYLLTGTVRWQKGAGNTNRVAVRPELVEVTGSAAPASRWQQPFDAELTDVFRVQSEIAGRVATALGVALGTGEERRLSEKPTQNLTAYDAFLRGEEASKSLGFSDPASLRRSLGFYEQAVALDPAFVQAWAQVSRTCSALHYLSTPSPALTERARQAAEKALALAPDRPEGHLALGDFQIHVARDRESALKHYARGRSLAPGNADLLTAAAVVEERLGRWEAAVGHFRQAERLDPRAALTLRRLGEAFLFLRRYPEARETLDRGLAFAPANLDLIEQSAMLSLAEGDLSGARAVLRSSSKTVEPTALVAYMANYWDLVWVLDEGQRDLLVRLTPSAFDDDKGAWGLCLAQAYALKNDAANVRSYAEEARSAFEKQSRANPEDAQRHFLHGLALAYLGRKDEAIRAGERGAMIAPLAKDAYDGPYLQHQLVRIYILVGEPEKALDRLEPLLRVPYFLSPGWLKIDPNFDPLRKNPRFKKLEAGAP